MAERDRLGKTGLFQFGYNFCAPAERGQAIVGLYFNQSNTGYIYDPLIRDEALKINSTSVSDFSQLISSEAEQRSRIKIGNANASPNSLEPDRLRRPAQLKRQTPTRGAP